MDGGTGGHPMRLAVVEVLDRDGHARQVVPVLQWPVTIGRAIDCDVVLDDVHVAGHHATLEEANGVVAVQLGETLNGALLPDRQLKANERAELRADDVFQVGATRLRVRRAVDAIAPERKMAYEHAPPFLLLAALVGVFALLNLAERWISVDPGGRLIDYLPTVLGTLLALFIWCGLWALGSRLFRHRFDYGRHLRIASSYFIATSIVGVGLPVLAYALGWAFFSRISGIAVGAVLWAMIFAHMSLMLPSRRHFLAIGMTLLFVAATGLYLTRNYQTNHRLFSELYVSALAPPVLRIASPVPTSRFIDDARHLKDTLDARVHDDDNEAGNADDDE
jgi:type III secretion system (T3SS) inner membrane Yop/YscD-like protein